MRTLVSRLWCFIALSGLTVAAAKVQTIPKVSYINNEPEFRWTLLQDQMAFDKLHEGIKKFAEDGDTLRNLLKDRLSK